MGILKSIFLSFLLFFFSNISYAQSTFSNTGSGINRFGSFDKDEDSIAVNDDEELTDEKVVKVDPLKEVQLEITDSLATFSNLPEKGYILAHITTTDGDIVYEKRVKPNKNTVDVYDLSRDKFFITLTYRKYRKSFPIDRKRGAKKPKIQGADNLN